MMKGKYPLVLAVLLCLCLTSCAPLVLFGVGTAAGISGHKYYKGALTVIYQAPYMETWDATLKALEGMNIRIQSKKHDLTAGKIKAKRADKKPVTVSMEYKSAQETEVVIRVGFLGDRNVSMAVKEQIRKELFKK